jgi:FKBP-type peptidyl-prolyl cis-trans isomerase
VAQVETAKRGPQRELLMQLWLNRAACLIPLGEFEKAEADCTAVLQKFDPSEPKARYRRALARRNQGKLFMAMADLEVAKKHTKGKQKIARIQQVIERLQDDMGVPGMCYTQKEILRGVPEPEPGEPPLICVERGDTVTCHATGYLQDGKKLFWTTRKKRKDEKTGDILEGEPFTYLAGRGRVIRGWDMGVLGMRIGEIRSLMVPAKEAYGEQGYTEFGIPPNADLLYDIEVVKIEQKPPLSQAALKWCGGPYMLTAILIMIAGVIYTFISDGLKVNEMRGYHGGDGGDAE